ncbi:hypothetical protein [Flavicella marina]|uniref:hypothetical protein n=1 Tax=Flavicella marina TaxID=1475951 RepID=UPI0012643B56|nr:hypothetical protein [Flavicella marina]
MNTRQLNYLLIIIFIFLFSYQGYNQQKVEYKLKNGETYEIERKQLNGFSIKIPDFDIPPTFNEKYQLTFVPIVLNDDFSVLLTVIKLPKNKNENLKDRLLSDLENYGKNGTWDYKTLHKYSSNEMKETNASQIYMISGHSTEKLPMKSFSSFYYLESKEKDQLIKVISGIDINPSHHLYNNYSEIKKYMYDMKVYVSTIKFE